MLRSFCRSLHRPAAVAASSDRRCLSELVSTSQIFSSERHPPPSLCRQRAPPPLHHCISSLSVSTPVRTLSTTTAQIPNSIETTSNSTTQNSKLTESSNNNETKNKKSSSKHPTDVLLDNIGTIFLTAIFSIIALLIRSSFGTNNKNATRDDIETYSVLDPLEIDDLRVANSELTPEVMEEIMKDVWIAFPTGEATYEEFVSVVVQKMRLMKGEAFTVELGHLLDRVMIAALEEEGEDAEEDKGRLLEESGVEKKVPLPLLFTVLSLALNGPVKERVRLLFNSLRQGKTTDNGREEEGRISRADATEMVSYLQRTCQLVPDAQVVEDDAKYPVQQYRRGTAEELVSRALNPDKKKKGDEKVVPETMTTLSDRDREDLEFDLNGFESLLNTRSVCAWGECYRKTKK